MYAAAPWGRNKQRSKLLSLQGSQDAVCVVAMHSFKAAHGLGDACYRPVETRSHTRSYRSSTAAKSEFRRCGENQSSVVNTEAVK